MAKIVITGNKPLRGSIEVSGMKNAAVAIVFGTILAEDKCVLGNIPMISDISDAFDILDVYKRQGNCKAPVNR